MMSLTRFALVCLLTLGALGQSFAESNDDFARDLYLGLPGPEMDLQFYGGGAGPIVGAHTKQKDDRNGGFCRATAAVYPGAPVEYACYGQLLTDADARDAYEGSTAGEMSVLFSINGNTLVGSAWLEKVVQLPDFSIPLLCVKTHAVVPNPVPSYTCFKELVPIGGGASIGN